MHCFFVIRSYTFLLSSHTFLPAFLYNLSNSDTFLYVLCDSHADSAISIRIPWLWPPPFTRESFGHPVPKLLSIKFPYVLLYVLIRSGSPHHFLELWDSRSAHSSAHLSPHRFPANQLSPVPKLLSIKFPYVLLYVLIRSGSPHHFLELWDSRSAHASAHLSPHHFPANQLSHSSACTEVGFKSLKMNILRHPSSCC